MSAPIPPRSGRPDIDVQLDPGDAARLLHDVRNFDRELSKSLGRYIRLAAKPVGERTLLRGAGGLPRSGGLSDRISEGRVSVSVRTGAGTAGVDIRLQNREGDDLTGLDKGEVRHPVFAQPGWQPRWVTQRIRAGLFTDEFKREERTIRLAVDRAIADAAATIRAGDVT